MRRSEDFLLKRTGDTTVIVPVGRAAVGFPGMIRVNETGEYLWELLREEVSGKALTDALLARYDVSEETVKADVDAFRHKLRLAGAIIE